MDDSPGQGTHNQYEVLFEHAPVGIWLEDFSDVRSYLEQLSRIGPISLMLEEREAVLECIRRVRILHVNRCARDFYGAVSSEQLTSGFEALFDDQTVEVFRKELLAFWNGEVTFETEIITQTLRGEERLVKMNCALLPQQAEPWSFVIVTFTDMTERQSLERNLRESERRAQEYAHGLAKLNKDLEQFAYSAAHDLREPLRTVSLYTQLLIQLQGDLLSDRADKAIQFILGGTKRMQQLITDLLNFAHAIDSNQTGEGDLHSDTNAVLQEALVNLDAAIQEAGGRVRVESLPALAVEPGHLRQLLQNLVGNAVKYRSPGRPLEIEVSACSDGSEVTLCIADNGLGIRPEYQEKIFGIFLRLHGPEIQGSGIGLALCRRIAAVYRGRVWVESDGRTGSRFFVTLPATSAAGSAAEL